MSETWHRKCEIGYCDCAASWKVMSGVMTGNFACDLHLSEMVRARFTELGGVNVVDVMRLDAIETRPPETPA